MAGVFGSDIARNLTASSPFCHCVVVRTPFQTWLVCAVLLQAVTTGAQTVTRVAGGGFHSLFLKSDGSLWAMGDNANGQLGDGTLNNTNRPEQILASGVTAIAGGYLHSLFLKSDGSLWAMGYNNRGQLGDGTYNDTDRPEQIVAGGVMAIAPGGDHSLFLKSDGSLWAMGDNDNGELGDGTYNRTNRPEQILASGVTAVAAGGFHSLFLKSDGSLWAMGDNHDGQLGDGTYSTNAPYGTNRPEQIVASGVTAIAGGSSSSHSLFLKSDGSLWAMGRNTDGELGDCTYSNTNRPERIVPLVIVPPTIASISLAGTNLVLNGINGTSCTTTNYVLMTTNVALPRSQWTPLATNILSASGNFTLTVTNAVDPAAQRRFYTLRLQ